MSKLYSWSKERERMWQVPKGRERTWQVPLEMIDVGEGLIVDTHVEGIGTVRNCIDCGCLIAGGSTRCIRCVREGPPRRSWWHRLQRWIEGGVK